MWLFLCFFIGWFGSLALCTLAGHDVGWHGWTESMCATHNPIQHFSLWILLIVIIFITFSMLSKGREQ